MNPQRGLFINTEKAVCSIHESGLMVFNCIKDSANYSLDYLELKKEELNIPATYDFYLFNYHFSTTGWLDTKSIKKLPGLKGTIVLEILPNDPFVYCSPFDFDFYCVLDPSMTFKHKKVFVFPRPLDEYRGELSNKENEIPVIGTFGFATKGKGFKHVVEAVNKEFEKAIVRINIPHGTYTDPSHGYAQELAAQCKVLAKKGIEVITTHDFMTKDALIYWCSENTLNCFLYDRNMPGLAATTDQAITSERPLSVSDNSTFRHVTKYLRPYPHLTLKESINSSVPVVKKMKEEWSGKSFRLLFEKMLDQLSAKKTEVSVDLLPVKLSLLNKQSFRYKFDRYFRRLTRLYYKSPLYAAFR
ncbi:MAG TPA: hypothetical protein VIV35_11240 [Chitinophagaceae bacterium]